MTTTRDTTLQSDVTKIKIEADGSFKRAESTFRDTIEKGGKFEPEAGGHFNSLPRYCFTQGPSRSLSSIRLVCLPYVSYPNHNHPRRLLRGLPLAWATRTLIVRKLKGLEDLIREHYLADCRA